MCWVIGAFTFIVTATTALQCFHCDDCERETPQLKECINDVQCYSILGPVSRRGCARTCPFNWEFVEEECHLCGEDACNYHTYKVFLQHPIRYHKKRSHKFHRRRRDERINTPEESKATTIRFLPDGTRVEVYKESGALLPSLPSLQDEIMFLNPADSRFGSIDDHGNIYVPVDEFGEVLPEYTYLIEEATRFSKNDRLREEFRSKLATEHKIEAERKTEINSVEIPVDIKLMETEALTPDGNVVTQIITDIQPVNIEKTVNLEENTKHWEETLEPSRHQKKSEAKMEMEAADVLHLPKSMQTKEKLQETKEVPKIHFEIKKDMTSEELAEVEAMLAELHGWTEEDESVDEEVEEDDYYKEDYAKKEKNTQNKDVETKEKKRNIADQPTTILHNVRLSSVYRGSIASFFSTFLVSCAIACVKHLL